jgi:dCMP deaminase
MMEGCCSAASPCSHQKRDPHSLCEICLGAKAPGLPIANRRSQDWWDRYFLSVAESVAGASKDPSTKVGAVIVRNDRTFVSFGYNGFPRGIADTAERLNDRTIKNDLVVHAEVNAIVTAREPLRGACIYIWPFLSCKKCALTVIQSGISRVVAPYNDNERWAASFKEAQDLYDEAGVSWKLIDMKVS